ncbi:helix-turn-helix transcriptional regulator [Arthrobacter sp. H-02-3]|uniref:helix-turn-helix transcriptional regulator n=1 Tax=Arthrobacter sp. H-02-3 TaxID=2703675 RepID=UPI00192A32FB|nr:LuxR C-terminal-related transcriptional regulator [Arthrobacter sp. H-02-3]
MARNEEQYRTWLEFLGEIFQQPLGVSSRYEEQLLVLLRQSFNGACCTRNRVSPAWEDHVLGCWPRDYIPDEPPGGYDFRQQPLLRWYAFSGQSGPQSFGRVPDALADSSLKRAWEEVSRPWGMNHQLSIPLQIGGGDHNAYLVSRPDRDFTEQELALARLLQPILTLLALHFGIAQSNSGASLDGSAHDLTAREMTIVTLLSQGLTAEGLARRLSISPRTVGKHLEHIYRKLDVRDRLMAVQTAHELGLLTATAANFRFNDTEHDRP